MAVTHTSFTAARDWLLQMGAGAADNNVILQYCMSLPRHVLQSAGIDAVGRLRTNGDYIFSKDNWWLGIFSCLPLSVSLCLSLSLFSLGLSSESMLIR